MKIYLNQYLKMMPLLGIEQLLQQKKENNKNMIDQLMKVKPKSEEEKQLINLHIKLMEGGICP